MRRLRFSVAFLLLLLCCRGAPCAEPESTPAYLERTRPAYQRALHLAGRWLLALPLDPSALQKAGIKGKKKLAEMLDALRGLEAALPAAERAPVRERLTTLAAATKQPGFHDMAKVPDDVFKQNSTSYLRIAYLLDRLGFDTSLYRQEIRKILPRLDRDMVKRGSHQRMAFHLYYRYFSLKEPFPLGDALTSGTIARHIAPELLNTDAIYSLTHEVFGPYEFGDKLDASYFGQKDLAYLGRTLPRLVETSIVAGDPDLVAELVTCMRYLKLDAQPVFRTALEFLLAAQRLDGAWGHYEEAERQLGELAKQGFYLHTTMVTLTALNAAFQAPPAASSRSGAR